MRIEKVSEEFAKDWIGLINSLKGIKYNAHVNYTTKSGQTTKFDYVNLDKIYDEIKKNNNFAINEPLGTDEMGQSALQVIAIHRTGETLVSDYYALRTPVNASKQDEGSAITYTKRYALGSFLGLSTDQDNDANPDGEGMKINEKKATSKQIELLLKIYKDENLSKLLKLNEIKKIEDITLAKASELISKAKQKMEERK